MSRRNDYNDTHCIENYHLKPIEDFLDAVYERNLAFATKVITEIYNEVQTLDLTDYSKIPQLIEALKREHVKMTDACHAEQHAYWREHHSEEYLDVIDDFREKFPEYRNEFCHLDVAIKTNSPEHWKQITAFRKLEKEDNKRIRAKYNFAGVKQQIENLKIEKEKAKAQHVALKAFYEKYPDAKDFDLTYIQIHTIKESAENYAYMNKEALRHEVYWRSEYAVGKLVDMTNIRIGENGSLNGIVVGEDGRKAKLTTTIAGGYNIQCLHYRVLIAMIRGD